MSVHYVTITNRISMHIKWIELVYVENFYSLYLDHFDGETEFRRNCNLNEALAIVKVMDKNGETCKERMKQGQEDCERIMKK